MSTYELLLYLHILGVFGLIAAAGISTAVGIRTGFGRLEIPRGPRTHSV